MSEEQFQVDATQDFTIVQDGGTGARAVSENAGNSPRFLVQFFAVFPNPSVLHDAIFKVEEGPEDFLEVIRQKANTLSSSFQARDGLDLLDMNMGLTYDKGTLWFATTPFEDRFETREFHALMCDALVTGLTGFTSQRVECAPPQVGRTTFDRFESYETEDDNLVMTFFIWNTPRGEIQELLEEDEVLTSLQEEMQRQGLPIVTSSVGA